MFTDHLSLPIIGYVHSPLSQKFGIPRQPNLVDIPAYIEMTAPFNELAAFEGIEQFSHLWVIWQCHLNRMTGNAKDVFRPQVRPPRLGGNTKIGVFATRSMYRPANIGLSVVQLRSIEIKDKQVRLHMIGADMVDGTPVVDIKPYIAYSDSLPNAQSGFAAEPPVTKQVAISIIAEDQANSLIENNSLSNDDIKIITNLIAQDPRPAYQNGNINQPYIMRYKNIDITFFSNPMGDFIINDFSIIK